MFNWPWSDGIWRLDLTHLVICCLLWDSTKGVARLCWVYYSVIANSIIFLFGTPYLDAAARRVDVPWTKDITYSKRDIGW